MSEYQEDMFEAEHGPGRPPLLSENDLFARLVTLNKEINERKEDIKQLIIDCKYHKKDNPEGHDAERVKYIAKSAATYAAGDYEEKKCEFLTFIAQFEDITNYND
jgi:hypothetical protein